MGEIIEEPAWGSPLSFCSEEPRCLRPCGRCRTRSSRHWAFHNDITHEEFDQCHRDLAPRGIWPWEFGKIRCHLHLLRRRNKPFEPERRRASFTVSEEELDLLKAWAAKDGKTLSDFLRWMVGLNEWKGTEDGR